MKDATHLHPGKRKQGKERKVAGSQVGIVHSLFFSFLTGSQLCKFLSPPSLCLLGSRKNMPRNDCFLFGSSSSYQAGFPGALNQARAKVNGSRVRIQCARKSG